MFFAREGGKGVAGWAVSPAWRLGGGGLEREESNDVGDFAAGCTEEVMALNV